MRFQRSVLFFVACALGVLAAACSAEDPSTTPRTVDPLTEPTTTAGSSTEVLGQVELTTIHVAPDGNDANSGAARSSALRTVEQALAIATPGDDIVLAAGTHPAIEIRNVHGTAGQPITIRGEGGQVTVSDGSYDRRAGVGIHDSSHIVVKNLRIRTSLWAVDTHRSQHLVLQGLDIDDIGQEAVHFRSDTSHVLVADNRITGTGNRPGYSLGGSGVYVGSASGDDRTHDVRIVGNEIWNTASEGIDVKAGTWNVLIERNRIHDVHTLQSGAVVLHLGYKPPDFDPNLVVRHNDIWNITSNTQWADGNAIVVDAAATVTGNRLWNTEHRGILVEDQFTAGNPRDVRITQNVMWRSGRHDIEIRGSAADVRFDDNHSADPHGGSWSGSGNAPATQAVFDAWTMGGPPEPPPPPPSTTTVAPTPTTAPPGSGPTPTTPTSSDTGADGQPATTAEQANTTAGGEATEDDERSTKPRSDRSPRSRTGIDLPPLSMPGEADVVDRQPAEPAKATAAVPGPAVARDVRTAGIDRAPTDDSGSLGLLAAIGATVGLGYVLIRGRRGI